MPNVLTQGHVRKKQFPVDGRFIQKLDAASLSNMEAVLEMKITLKQKKDVVNAAHLKVGSCFVFLVFLFFASSFAFFSFLLLCLIVLLF